MRTPRTLEKLLTAVGPSGYEGPAAAVWREQAAKFATAVSGDTIGNSFAHVAGKKRRPRLAVIGHIDEIGLIVNHIGDDGLLHFLAVGGWDPQVLVGQRVEIATKDGSLSGVVGKKPIHLLKPDERKQASKLEQMHIDIGAADAEEAELVVRVGDVAVIAAEPVRLLGDRLASRALDNRIGAYVAFEAARLLAKDGKPAGEFIAAAVVQEEITFGGSRTGSFSLEPDAAIVVDVTHETSQPGVAVNELGSHEFGSGPVLTRGSTMHPVLFELIAAAGDEAEIPYTVEASARRTGTDADAVHLTRAGIPTALVSIPLRYMHSPVETCQLDDVENAARLIAAAARRFDGKVELTR